MTLATGSSEPANPVEADYASWQPDRVPLSIRIHLDVIDGIRRDFLEDPDKSTTGLLRGFSFEGSPAVLQVERYQRLTPALTDPDQADIEQNEALGSYAASLTAATHHPQAGAFHLRITPDNSLLFVQVFLRGVDGVFLPTQPLFPFTGRTLETADAEDDTADTARSDSRATPGREYRLVPDFDPASSPSGGTLPDQFEAEASPSAVNRLQSALPFVAAVVLVGAALGVMWWLQSPRSGTPPPPSKAPAETVVRPLGLYIDASLPQWRVSWNRDATVLQGASGVRLFVRDGEEQNRVDLSPRDLESGTWQYQPQGRDVTFRLEATGKDGRVAAESFRLLSVIPPQIPVPPAAPPSHPSTPPRATSRVAAVVAPGVRSKIHGKIPIDVRVQVDSRGRVTSAVPVKKARSGLDKTLAASAVRAALEWKFAPATQNGKPISGSQTIHFVFER